MIKNLNKSVSSIEELLLFYNKYLALDNDEVFLLNLVTNMTNTFNAKIPTEKEQKVYEIPLEEPKYNEMDFANMSMFARKCVNFWDTATITISNLCEVKINSIGNILEINSINPEMQNFNNSDIFSFLEHFSYLEGADKAKKDLNNVIIQNVLASKIYKTVSEQVRITKGIYASNAFRLINYGIINYENTIASRLENKEQINHGFSRVRSQR